LDFDETNSTRPGVDEELHLTIGIGEPDERTSALVRERFLISVIVHLILIIVVVTNPDLFERLFPAAEVVEVQPPPQDVTLLYTPPPELRPPPRLTEPPAPPPRQEPAPEQQRQPELRAPVTPRLPQPAQPPPEMPRQPGMGGLEGIGEELEARRLPPIGIPELPEPAREPPPQAPEPQSLPEPKIEPVPRPDESEARLRLPAIGRPTRGTEAILRGIARDRATRAGGGSLSGIPEFDPDEPNMSIPGPQILSDTMGVDFHPYLLRVYLIVRRNWYSVIPEIARLGKQGRVALEFSIERNGRVPDLVLRVGSGTDSLDSAALASIRLSNPFPALPPEFPGEDIRLRFVYLYNVPIGSN
jgi:TonB family protein